MRPPASALAALALAAVGCSTTKAPTYTDATIKLTGCPKAPLHVRRHVELEFVASNRSHGTWPATYLLLSLQGQAKGDLTVANESSKGIGGGIRRDTSPPAPGAKVRGSLSVYLEKPGSGTVGVGVWGAPANSVAVPGSYRTASCTLHGC